MAEEIKEATTELKEIELPSVIRVGDLAQEINQPVSSVISNLMKNGVLASINEMVDFDTASIIVYDFGFTAVPKEEKKQEAKKVTSKKMVKRPPVVTVMGHVDHGKTSLLDAIRETNVVGVESGGITQHIGAYQVEVNDRTVTFLDTPGHEAFSAMRAHGANLTDVIVLVVAADDGVKPQTLEAISLAKTSEIPMVVAINKMDAPGANKDKVMQELGASDVIPEEWGGNTIMVPVSAKTKEGLDKLLEMILLVADVKTLEAAQDVQAAGVVIESKLDPGKGPVATVLVQNGILREASIVQVGGTYGRIKYMEDHRGKKIKEAPPSTPVRISGLKEVPQVGDFLQEFSDEKSARDEATNVLQHRSAKRLFSVKKLDLDEITSAVKQGEVKELNIVLKADVQGSLDALVDSIAKIKNDEVSARIVKKGVGEVSDSDVAFAKSTSSVVLGFKVGVAASAKQLAQREKISYSIYDVIYELLDDIKKGLSSLLAPLIKENEVGSMKILKVFKTGKTDVIVGGRVEDGKMIKGVNVQILEGKGKEKVVVATGKSKSVQRDKDEVAEVPSGSEGGALLDLDNPKSVKEGDMVRFYEIEEIKRTL